MIEQLEKSHDPLVKKFTADELVPLKTDNRYHSMEESETDEDSLSGKRKLVTRDLQWRSSTVSK